jgi:predicted nucleotidyltransferase
MKRDEILTILSQFKRDHGAQYAILEIGVFGSVARGEESEESDVDIVFKTNSPNLFRTASMKARLEELLDRRVDVVRYRERMSPHLKQRILKEARYV